MKELSMIDKMEIRSRCIKATAHYAKYCMDGYMQSWTAFDRQVRRIQELTELPYDVLREALYPFTVYEQDDGTYRPYFESLRKYRIPIPTQAESEEFFKDRQLTREWGKRMRRRLK